MRRTVRTEKFTKNKLNQLPCTFTLQLQWENQAKMRFGNNFWLGGHFAFCKIFPIGPPSQKLWPNLIVARFPHCNYNTNYPRCGVTGWTRQLQMFQKVFAGSLRSTGISQLRAGKTRSKRPRSHWLSTVHLLPYMWASFYPLDPSRYLSSISSWRPKTKKFPFFTNFHGHLQKKFVGLLRTQFWCYRPST